MFFNFLAFFRLASSINGKKTSQDHVIPEEKKLRTIGRKDQKIKAKVLDPHRRSRIAADAITAMIVDRLKTIRDVEIITML